MTSVNIAEAMEVKLAASFEKKQQKNGKTFDHFGLSQRVVYGQKTQPHIINL